MHWGACAEANVPFRWGAVNGETGGGGAGWRKPSKKLARGKGELGSEEAGGTGVHGARWMGEYAQRTIKGRNQ